jgi:uncharacterized Zn finger protein
MIVMSVRQRPVGDEFRKCDACGYDRGFHSSFVKQGERYRVILICPECGARYDVGWMIELPTR